MLSPIVNALPNKVETINSNSPYFKHFTRDLHESDGLLYMDGKLVIPFTLRNAMMKTFHETHSGQFGMNCLIQYIWWPHINRQIYFPGIICSECTMAGKNLKTIIPNSLTSELPPLLETNEEVNLDFAGPLDSYWRSKKYIFILHRSSFKISFGKNYFIYLSCRISPRYQLSNFSKITYSYTVYHIQ